MNTKEGFLAKVITVIIIAVFPLLAYLYVSKSKESFIPLPKLGAIKVDAHGDTIYHTIPDFKLISQTGAAFTKNDLKNKFYVADFFFTSCPSICPKMSKNLALLQKAFIEEKDFRIISHTVDPQRDSIGALAKYADKYKADNKVWYFLTSDKKAIYSLAREGYFIVATEGDGGENDFVHSEKFVLVDKKGIIRGYYNGTDSLEVRKLMQDIVKMIVENKKK